MVSTLGVLAVTDSVMSEKVVWCDSSLSSADPRVFRRGLRCVTVFEHECVVGSSVG